MTKLGEFFNRCRDKKYREGFYLVPAASNMPQRNEKSITHVFTIPDGYKRRKGTVNIVQRIGETAPSNTYEVLYDALRCRMLVRSTDPSSQISEIQASGNQKVIVEDIALKQAAAFDEARIIVRADVWPEKLELNKGKVTIKRPRRFRLL